MTGKTINVDIKKDEKLLDQLEEHVKKATSSQFQKRIPPFSENLLIIWGGEFF